jgi:hypothetical protein
MTGEGVLVPISIENQIRVLRGHKVLLDSDLAALYAVETRALNQAVKRNKERFPPDFVFQLTAEENEDLKSQTVISSSIHAGRRHAPYAFTEHGPIMAASVLNSSRAVEMSIHVVRAFLRLRETLASHKALAAKLAELEQRLEGHNFGIALSATRIPATGWATSISSGLHSNWFRSVSGAGCPSPRHIATIWPLWWNAWVRT